MERRDVFTMGRIAEYATSICTTDAATSSGTPEDSRASVQGWKRAREPVMLQTARCVTGLRAAAGPMLSSSSDRRLFPRRTLASSDAAALFSQRTDSTENAYSLMGAELLFTMISCTSTWMPLFATNTSETPLLLGIFMRFSALYITLRVLWIAAGLSELFLRESMSMSNDALSNPLLPRDALFI